MSSPRVARHIQTRERIDKAFTAFCAEIGLVNSNKTFQKISSDFFNRQWDGIQFQQPPSKNPQEQPQQVTPSQSPTKKQTTLKKDLPVADKENQKGSKAPRKRVTQSASPLYHAAPESPGKPSINAELTGPAAGTVPAPNQEDTPDFAEWASLLPVPGQPTPSQPLICCPPLSSRLEINVSHNWSGSRRLLETPALSGIQAVDAFLAKLAVERKSEMEQMNIPPVAERYFITQGPQMPPSLDCPSEQRPRVSMTVPPEPPRPQKVANGVLTAHAVVPNPEGALVWVAGVDCGWHQFAATRNAAAYITIFSLPRKEVLVDQFPLPSGTGPIVSLSPSTLDDDIMAALTANGTILAIVLTLRQDDLVSAPEWRITIPVTLSLTDAVGRFLSEVPEVHMGAVSYTRSKSENGSSELPKQPKRCTFVMVAVIYDEGNAHVGWVILEESNGDLRPISFSTWCHISKAAFLKVVCENKMEGVVPLEVEEQLLMMDAAVGLGCPAAYQALFVNLVSTSWAEVVGSEADPSAVGRFKTLYFELFLDVWLKQQLPTLHTRDVSAAPSPSARTPRRSIATMATTRRLDGRVEFCPRPAFNGVLLKQVNCDLEGLFDVWVDAFASSRYHATLIQKLREVSQRLQSGEASREELGAVAAEADQEVERNKVIDLSKQVENVAGVRSLLFLRTLEVVFRLCVTLLGREEG